METAVVTLKLVLDELGVPPAIDTLARRKQLQKVVELVQGVGVDLGYTFGWYIRGPYSPALTRDYFALDEAMRVDDAHPEAGYQLRNHTKEKLGRIKPILEPPRESGLSQPDWLELLASLHYLQVNRKLEPGEADDLIRQRKAHVASRLEDGRKALEAAGLL